MAMTYDAFLDQMKKDLESGFAENPTAAFPSVWEMRRLKEISTCSMSSRFIRTECGNEVTATVTIVDF